MTVFEVLFFSVLRGLAAQEELNGALGIALDISGEHRCALDAATRLGVVNCTGAALVGQALLVSGVVSNAVVGLANTVSSQEVAAVATTHIAGNTAGDPRAGGHTAHRRVGALALAPPAQAGLASNSPARVKTKGSAGEGGIGLASGSGLGPVVV